MLSRYFIFRLLWIVGTFAASIAFVDPLKALLPTEAVVGIVIFPLVITLIGETLDEETKSERLQRAGLWMQLSGASSLLLINIASLVLMQNQNFNDKWMFYVMVLASVIPLSVLSCDCYLGLFKNKRLTLPDSSEANNWTAIGISLCFVACVLFICVKNASISLEIYAAGLFFSMCAAICLSTWWVKKQLSGEPKISRNRQVGAFDLSMYIGGAAGAALVVKSLIVHGTFVSSYEIMVGALFFCLALFFAVHRIGRALRYWSSVVATRDGLLELHPAGTVLFRWESIAEVSLVPIAASAMAIVVTLNVELPSVEPNMRSGVDNDKIARWKRQRRERWESNRLNYQADLLILDPQCLYGIVNLWHAVRLVLADESQRMKLPPTSDFTIK